jgi:hypothetical protein
MAGDCNACFYAGDYDPPSFYVVTKRFARKQHHCCECGEPIAPRQLYERAVGRWDSSVDTFKTCIACAEIRDTFSCEGYVHGALWENIRESMFESMTTGCLDKLATAVAKAKLLAEWREWKFADV